LPGFGVERQFAHHSAQPRHGTCGFVPHPLTANTGNNTYQHMYAL
jgi:hypothetical protein